MATSVIPQEFVFETQKFKDISVQANSFTMLTLSAKTGYVLASVYFLLGGPASGYSGFVKMNGQTSILVNNFTNNNVSNWEVTAYCLWRKT